jgi:Rrf2 family transcriptional regulator, iron-sulfur cluster assembly transcription factor
MMLTTKGRYAVMAMVDIAYHSANNKPVALHDICERQKIALSYLEQLFNKLKKSRLVISFKGPGGGYILSKDPAQTNILEIISSVDESIKITRCSSKEGKNCLQTSSTPCFTHALWEGLGRQISEYLLNTSLADICKSIKKCHESI